jgi:hypothetical protein
MKTNIAAAVLSAAAAAFLVSPFGSSSGYAQEAAGTTKPAEMNELEKKFEQQMSGATLVGRFSVDSKDDQLPKEDRYVITKVTKMSDDLWIFSARIGKGKFAIPLPVPVKWAGDTPVISVTKLSIPKGGTYTARVVIYGDRYAGTWDAGDHGGQMWGRIERPESTTQPSEKPSDKP